MSDQNPNNATAAGRPAAASSTAPEGTAAVLADRDTGFVAISAVRYCIGRRTYAPSLVADWLRRVWRYLDRGTHSVIARDVQEAIRDYERHLPGGDLDDASDNLRQWSARSLGDDCDRAVWYNLRDWMREQGVSEAR